MTNTNTANSALTFTKNAPDPVKTIILSKYYNINNKMRELINFLEFSSEFWKNVKTIKDDGNFQFSSQKKFNYMTKDYWPRNISKTLHLNMSIAIDFNHLIDKKKKKDFIKATLQCNLRRPFYFKIGLDKKKDVVLTIKSSTLDSSMAYFVATDEMIFALFVLFYGIMTISDPNYPIHVTLSKENPEYVKNLDALFSIIEKDINTGNAKKWNIKYKYVLDSDVRLDEEQKAIVKDFEKTFSKSFKTAIGIVKYLSEDIQKSINISKGTLRLPGSA